MFKERERETKAEEKSKRAVLATNDMRDLDGARVRWGREEWHADALLCCPDDDTPPPLWHTIERGLEHGLLDLVSHADEGRNQETQHIAVGKREDAGNVLKEHNLGVEVPDIVQKHNHHPVLLVLQRVCKVAEAVDHAHPLARRTAHKHRNLTSLGEVPLEHGTAVKGLDAVCVMEATQRHPRVFLHRVTLPVHKVVVFSLWYVQV